MITWMQRRKKLLVIVMWVTVLAFVGAGFVGWGSYDYGTKASSIASVGDVPVKREELQNEYNRLYSYYNQLFDGNLPQAQAEELKSIALQQLINKAYLMNLANEFGLVVSDEEVAEEIVGMNEFKENGTFNRDLYENALKNARLTKTQFEESLRKDILLTKLAKLFDYDVSETEKKTVGASVFLSDKIAVKIIEEKDIALKLSSDEVKKYWEGNKDRYMGEPTFDIGYIQVDSQGFAVTEAEAKEYFEKNPAEFLSLAEASKGFEAVKKEVVHFLKMKQAKKEVLKKRVALKKGKVEAVIANGIALTNDIVPAADMRELEDKASMEVSKPIETAKGYVVVKLLDRHTPKPLSFEQAKPQASKDLHEQKIQEALEMRAQNELKGFKGKTVGFVTRNDVNKFENLTTEESSLFLAQLFNAKEKKGFVNLGKKVVLYEIEEQKLLDSKKYRENSEFITSNTKRMKKVLMDTEMIQYLQDRYEVQRYYEGI